MYQITPEILFKYCFFNTNFINSVVGTLSLEVFTLNRIAVHIMFFSSVVSMCLQEQTQSLVSHTGSPELGHILLKKKSTSEVEEGSFTSFFAHSHYPFSHCLTHCLITFTQHIHWKLGSWHGHSIQRWMKNLHIPTMCIYLNCVRLSPIIHEFLSAISPYKTASIKVARTKKKQTNRDLHTTPLKAYVGRSRQTP